MGLSSLKLAYLVVDRIEPNGNSKVDDEKEACKGNKRPKIGQLGERFVVVPRRSYYGVPCAHEAHEKDAYN